MLLAWASAQESLRGWLLLYLLLPDLPLLLVWQACRPFPALSIHWSGPAWSPLPIFLPFLYFGSVVSLSCIFLIILPFTLMVLRILECLLILHFSFTFWHCHWDAHIAKTLHFVSSLLPQPHNYSSFLPTPVLPFPYFLSPQALLFCIP